MDEYGINMINDQDRWRAAHQPFRYIQHCLFSTDYSAKGSRAEDKKNCHGPRDNSGQIQFWTEVDQTFT